jgi:hypothetical protein
VLDRGHGEVNERIKRAIGWLHHFRKDQRERYRDLEGFRTIAHQKGEKPACWSRHCADSHKIRRSRSRQYNPFQARSESRQTACLGTRMPGLRLGPPAMKRIQRTSLLYSQRMEQAYHPISELAQHNRARALVSTDSESVRSFRSRRVADPIIAVPVD